MNICALSVASRIGTRFLQYACALLALFALCICTRAIAADAGDSANIQQTHEHVTSADSDKTQSADTLQTIMVTAYVPRETNAGAKMPVPLVETPQSATEASTISRLRSM